MHVLIFRPDHIGDVLLTTPVIRAIKNTYPACKLTMVVGKWALPMVENNPSIDVVFELSCPWLDRSSSVSWSVFYEQLSAIRKVKCDIAINFRKAVKETIVFRLLSASKRVGFDVWKCRWAHTHLTTYKREEHVVDNYMRLLNHIEIKTGAPDLEWIIPAEREADVVSKGNLPDKYIVVAATSGAPSRLWPQSSWIIFARNIVQDYGITLLLCGAPHEYDYLESISRQAGVSVVNCAGRYSLQELAVVMQKSIGVISLESAPAHIAVAMRVPVFALYWENDPQHWGPYPNGLPNHIIYRSSADALTADDAYAGFRNWFMEIQNIPCQ